MKKLKEDVAAKVVTVKLTVSRCGPGAAMRGSEIDVTAAEAQRMHAAGQIEKPAAAVLALFDALTAQAAEVVETAAAEKPAAAETATAPAAGAAEGA